MMKYQTLVVIAVAVVSLPLVTTCTGLGSPSIVALEEPADALLSLDFALNQSGVDVWCVPSEGRSAAYSAHAGNGDDAERAVVLRM